MEQENRKINAAFNRYRKLDEIFRNQEIGYTVKELYKHLEVSKKQIYKDIKYFQQEYKAPLEKFNENGKKIYRYSDPNFSISNLNHYTKKELDTLNAAKEILARKNDSWLTSMRIKKILNDDNDNDDETKDYILFPPNLNIEIIKHLEDLYNYCLEEQSLEIDYVEYTQNTQNTITASPYILKQYNNRWFLFYGNHTEETIFPRALAIDKITDIRTSKEKFRKLAEDFNFEDEIFSEIIGVSFNTKEEVMNIKIQLYNEQIHYVKNKPLHDSQSINSDGILKLKVRPNYELYSNIIALGENAEVLEPESVRKQIKEKIEKMAQRYA